MGILNREEWENLKSLKQDLVGPIKDFAAEVREDSIGDAKRFYSAEAHKAAQNVRRAQEKAAQRPDEAGGDRAGCHGPVQPGGHLPGPVCPCR